MFSLSICAMICRDQFRFISFSNIHDLAISFYGKVFDAGCMLQEHHGPLMIGQKATGPKTLQGSVFCGHHLS